MPINIFMICNLLASCSELINESAHQALSNKRGARRWLKTPSEASLLLPLIAMASVAYVVGAGTESFGCGDPARARMVPLTEGTPPLARLSLRQFRHTKLGGEKIERVLDRAPGNNAPIGGIKVITKNGWFAARPSGTENIYKLYAESFRGEKHLERILDEAQAMVDGALGMKRKG
jgi:Phosphoglucomutase/phosphomannomutase, C-terminal domain